MSVLKFLGFFAFALSIVCMLAAIFVKPRPRKMDNVSETR